MKLLKVIIGLFFLIKLAFSWAQDSIDPKDVSYLKQTGQMFTVKIIPGDKESKFFILGKEAIKIKLDKLKIEASLVSGKLEKKISLRQQEDYFVTSVPLKGDQLNLKIQEEAPGKMDEIKIKLKP